MTTSPDSPIVRSRVAAIVLAPPREQERIITGLTLGERGRRVAVRAGIPADHVHVVRSVAELEAAARAVAGRPVVVIRATAQVVAIELLEPLRLEAAGARAAFDAAGAYAGAIRVDADDTAALLAALTADLAAGERAAVAAAARVVVDRRARHPAGAAAEARAATAWQFELVDKPLDGFLTRRIWRPASRPFTRVLLRTPLTPNMISAMAITMALVGAAIAAGPSYGAHVLGIGMLFLSSVFDCCDGEVARLRLESSKLGGWLDTIGDDVSRLAVMLGIGLHVAHLHPDLPIRPVMVVVIGLTMIPMALLLYYCVFIGKTSNNQDFTKELGVGPGVSEHDAKTFSRVIGDLAAQVARRDFLDLAVIVFAVLGVSELSAIGMALGAVVGPIVIVPNFIKVLRRHRAEQPASA